MSVNPYAPQQYDPWNRAKATKPTQNPGAQPAGAPGQMYTQGQGGQGVTSANVNTPSTAATPIQAGVQYDPEHAEIALRNAMRARGINAGNTTNPYVRQMLGSASGLANSFMLRAAEGQIPGGTTADSINQAGGVGTMFGNFLSQALSGGLGSIHTALRQFGPDNTTDRHTALNSLAQVMHADQKAAEDNPAGSAFNGNVFAARLRDMLQRDPTNGAALIASLYSPFLTPGMSSSYGNQMANIGEMAPSFLNPDDLNENPFSYLLGQKLG